MRRVPRGTAVITVTLAAGTVALLAIVAVIVMLVLAVVGVW